MDEQIEQIQSVIALVAESGAELGKIPPQASGQLREELREALTHTSNLATLLQSALRTLK